MTVLEVADRASWKAHLHLMKFTAADERDAMHELFPLRARIVDHADKRGQLHKVPRFLIPHIEGDMMLQLGLAPFEVQDHPGNLLCNAGINRLGSLLIAGGGQGYDNTHCALLIGDTSTAATASDTDLNATVNAANRWVQVADSTYPTFATQVLTVQATVATANGNFTSGVQEWAIAQNASSAAAAATAPLLNHKVIDLGKKTSATAWTLRATVTIS